MLFWGIIDVFLLVFAAMSVYAQSKITIRATYNWWSVIYGAIFSYWMMVSVPGTWYFILLIATFMLINVVSGNGGLTQSRVVGNNVFFANTIRYQDVVQVTITDFKQFTGKDQVLAIFMTKNHRSIRLKFKTTSDDIIKTLRSHMPDNIEIKQNQLFN